jgi:CheY-like chemotaxis protein
VNSHLEITVSDTGMGIKPEFLPFVFDRFRQADQSSTRSYGGLGLGLAIVKHLVELHGGSVSATSAGEGQGATFSIVLPLTVVKEAGEERVHPLSETKREDEAALKSISLDGLVILVVDDEPDACALIRRVLEDAGAEVITANSSAEGLAALASSSAGRFDLVISDIGMPGEDGYKFIRSLRAIPEERGGLLPAVALTAFARTEDRTRALIAGYQVHLAKPVDPLELLATVASFTRRIRPTS